MTTYQFYLIDGSKLTMDSELTMEELRDTLVEAQDKDYAWLTLSETSIINVTNVAAVDVFVEAPPIV